MVSLPVHAQKHIKTIAFPFQGILVGFCKKKLVVPSKKPYTKASPGFTNTAEELLLFCFVLKTQQPA